MAWLFEKGVVKEELALRIDLSLSTAQELPVESGCTGIAGPLKPICTGLGTDPEDRSGRLQDKLKAGIIPPSFKIIYP
jgi:hypothetical protein